MRRGTAVSAALELHEGPPASKLSSPPCHFALPFSTLPPSPPLLGGDWQGRGKDSCSDGHPRAPPWQGGCGSISFTFLSFAECPHVPRGLAKVCHRPSAAQARGAAARSASHAPYACPGLRTVYRPIHVRARIRHAPLAIAAGINATSNDGISSMQCWADLIKHCFLSLRSRSSTTTIRSDGSTLVAGTYVTALRCRIGAEGAGLMQCARISSGAPHRCTCMHVPQQAQAEAACIRVRTCRLL